MAEIPKIDDEVYNGVTGPTGDSFESSSRTNHEVPPMKKIINIKLALHDLDKELNTVYSGPQDFISHNTIYQRMINKITIEIGNMSTDVVFNDDEVITMTSGRNNTRILEKRVNIPIPLPELYVSEQTIIKVYLLNERGYKISDLYIVYPDNKSKEDYVNTKIINYFESGKRRRLETPENNYSIVASTLTNCPPNCMFTCFPLSMIIVDNKI